MYFNFAEIEPKEQYKLLVATITPRPIAWVVSQDHEGNLNAAPYSFFNALSGDPPVIGIGMGNHEPGRPKDSLVNIRKTGEFVVNLVSEKNAEAMNVTAIDFANGVSELTEAGLTTIASTNVKTPRIAESPVALECELMQIVELGPARSLVLGRVLAMHICDTAILDATKHYVDTPKLKLIGLMHGAGWYVKTSNLFKMDRIPLANWNQKQGD